ncbi:MAG: two-component regulator propeller domain-containing protein, partial [Brumimicrobium sp.]|nr:two-component regulator propeller domain-containing protein [Brumimicrobium sp.]
MRSVFLLASLLLCLTAFSQRYAFINYSTKEGLPQSQVNAIIQDQDGYLWVGTLGGLARFDGHDFTSFGKNDGLLNNRITHLEIVNERIYVGHDKGISFQCAVDSFCTVSLPQDIPP